jgi:hypothetical protein
MVDIKRDMIIRYGASRNVVCCFEQTKERMKGRKSKDEKVDRL